MPLEPNSLSSRRPLPTQNWFVGAVLLACCLVLACSVESQETCTELFGNPNEATGLSETMCSPTCACGKEPWTAPTYAPELIQTLKAKVLTNPFPNLEVDPYTNGEFKADENGGYCAIIYGDENRSTYSLKTYPTEEAATSAGAFITHRGPCGLCSTLTDLAVYIANPDLTEPVRACGFKGILESPEANLQCLEEIGFTKPCAQIWLYNTTNTRKECEVCFDLLNASYNETDGRLNECLQCDEDKSGPIFKAVSARTRRNSGLPTAICRPCEGVYPLTHDYF